MNELEARFDNLYENGYGNFPDGHYWSSSEIDDVLAWERDFNHEGFYHWAGQTKGIPNIVRAVRAF